MYSDELIRHPDLQPLMKKYKKAFPKVDLEGEMLSLGWFGYTGMGLDHDRLVVFTHAIGQARALNQRRR